MLTFTDILRQKKLATLISLSAIGLAGIALLIVGAIGYWSSSQQNSALQNLDTRLANMPHDNGHQVDTAELEEVASQAKMLGQSLPEVDYIRLWQQWHTAVNNFKQINAALNNRYLAIEQRLQLQAFYEQMLALRDNCVAVLEDKDDAPMPLGWKLHNLKGNVSVLLAYSVLNFEQDGRKAAKFLSDAIDDYKMSIDLADQTSTSSMDRALPRWNMELIVGLGEYRKIGLSEVRQENMAEVQEQLEAFIPDVAGFAPGVPLETRVQK